MQMPNTKLKYCSNTICFNYIELFYPTGGKFRKKLCFRACKLWSYGLELDVSSAAYSVRPTFPEISLPLISMIVLMPFQSTNSKIRKLNYIFLPVARCIVI